MNYWKPYTLLLLCIMFVASANAQIRLNEVMIQPNSGNTMLDCNAPAAGNEYVEIYNASKCDSVDVSCFFLGSNTGSGNNATISLPAGSVIPPLGFIVVGGSGVAGADINWEAACGAGNFCVDGSGTFNLPDDDGWIALYDANGDIADAVFWTAAAGQPNTLSSNPVFANVPCKTNDCSISGDLAAANTLTPGLQIQYAGRAPIAGTVIFRSTDGTGNWITDGAPSLGTCNGNCAQPSDLSAVFDSIVPETCLLQNGLYRVEPTGGEAPYTYEWNFGENDQIEENLSAGFYAVTVTDDEGCTYVITDTLPNIGQPANATVVPDTVTIFQGDDLPLTISLTNTIDSAVWSPTSGLSCINCENPTASPNQTTTYVVRITDTDGCVGTARSVITVLKDENSLFIATAFTPNADGQNDILFVRSPRLETIDFRVYDRWGQEVFATTELTEGWDGTNKAGQEMVQGVYVYFIEAQFTNGTSRTIKGNVTLLR